VCLPARVNQAFNLIAQCAQFIAKLAALLPGHDAVGLEGRFVAFNGPLLAVS